ncbi:MAG: tol-pal system-associated acyl-CoA thioesterase [Burkholderiales bacterium]|nr:tol-pal system-associated acyl-CoA thioesterase [Burkholderiales bacterium]
MKSEESTVPAAHFHHPVRVYWEDTDAGGIVFYANYLKFFERARTEWLRALGHSQQEMVDTTGCMFVVQDTRVRYLRPARLDDLLVITVDVTERGKASLRITQQAWCGDRLLTEGEIRIGCVERATLKPTRIPGPILEAIEE